MFILGLDTWIFYVKKHSKKLARKRTKLMYPLTECWSFIDFCSRSPPKTYIIGVQFIRSFLNICTIQNTEEKQSNTLIKNFAKPT